MPTLPSELSEWLTLLTQPAVILLGVGLYVNLQNKRIDDLNKRIDDLNKRIDDLREDVKDGLAKLETRQREELKAMEARQREDNKALNEKLDRLLEARFSNQPVAPDR